MWEDLFSSVDLLQKGLNASWLRNEVIGNNIANVDTPGYKASGVKFEDLMASALGTDESGLDLTTTDDRQISKSGTDLSDVEPEVVENDSTSETLDDNNVDMETQMAALAKNSIEYYTLVSKVNSEFKNLDKAINVS